MIGDAEATKGRLIAAAMDEFATYGIAGARVDRIAAAAASNKAQIYHYFGSKDRLFDAVWEALVAQVVVDVPLDVRDLPKYGALLADSYARNPHLTRLITWQRLERSNDLPLSVSIQSIEEKVAAIRRAQNEHIISERFDAKTTLMLLLHTAALWSMSSPDVLAVVGPSDAEQRMRTVSEAISRMFY